MSKKANPVAVGIFVLGALVLAVVAVVLFGSGRYFSQKEKFILYFDDSVNGLDIGASVKFRGVPIGQVTDIYIRHNQPVDYTHIPVIIEIDTERLIKVHNLEIDLSDEEVYRQQIDLGLRATLQQASFVTGLLFVEMNFYDDPPPPQFIQLPKDKVTQPYYKEIPTLRSGLTEVIQKVSFMVSEISQIDFLGMGEDARGTLAALRAALEALDVEGINDNTIATLAHLRRLLEDPEVQAVAQNVNETMGSVKTLLQNADGGVTDIRALVSQANEAVNPLFESLNATADEAQLTLAEARVTLRNLGELVEPGSPLAARLDYTLSEVGMAARSLRQLADYLERNPDSILTGRDNSQE